MYEYMCEKCGHRFEALQNLNDRPVSACPECNGGVRKLLSAVTPMSSKRTGSGTTCCAREERCGRPPCSDGGECCR